MVDDLDLMGVLVEVDIEVMAEQVGLDKRMLFGHRLHLDFLGAHEQIVLFVFWDEVGQLVERGLDLADGLLAATVDDLGLVLAQLARDLVRGNVDCRVHVGVSLGDADDGADGAHRYLADRALGVGRVLFSAKDNLGVHGGAVEDLECTPDFLVNVILQCRGNACSTSGYCDSHDEPPCSKGLWSDSADTRRCV